jgi:secretion/DNA translocation related TadE-like protein
MVRLESDPRRGSATVLSLGLSAATLALGGVLVSTLHLVSVAQQVQQVANLAALAASDTAIGVTSGLPCRTARTIVTLHGFALTSCELDGSRARVSVGDSVWGLNLSRGAEAAPEPSAVWIDETPGR